MDDNYQAYLDRIASLTTPSAHASKLQHVVESPKFVPTPDGTRKPAPFVGFSIITPPGSQDATNAEFYRAMAAAQAKICDRLSPNFFAPVPPESFHFTLADLIWASAYEDAAMNPQFDARLRDCIGEIFQAAQPSLNSANSPRWKASGLVVMPRAIAMTLIPADEAAYDRLLRLRRALYQNPQLMGLGVEQQYYLTAHVTLGYFGQAPADLDREAVAKFLADCSDEAIAAAPPFVLQRAEFRKFEDMTRYERQPNFPVLTL